MDYFQRLFSKKPPPPAERLPDGYIKRTYNDSSENPISKRWNYDLDDDLLHIECVTVEQAEEHYARLRREGCWQMIKPLKIGWSWDKLRWVAKFSMKKCDKPYHLDDYLKDSVKAMSFLSETLQKIKQQKKNVPRS